MEFYGKWIKSSCIAAPRLRGNATERFSVGGKWAEPNGICLATIKNRIQRPQQNDTPTWFWGREGWGLGWRQPSVCIVSLRHGHKNNFNWHFCWFYCPSVFHFLPPVSLSASLRHTNVHTCDKGNSASLWHTADNTQCLQVYYHTLKYIQLINSYPWQGHDTPLLQAAFVWVYKWYKISWWL